MDQILLKTRDAAGVLGVSPSQVGKWERDGLLQPIRIPGMRAKRYAAADVQALAERFIELGRVSA